MTTITVKASRGWPVDVCPVSLSDGRQADPTTHIPVGDEQTFDVRDGEYLRIVEASYIGDIVRS